ncbi:pyridoxamine 5'-phosphate oxidase family protein [Mycolicibacterium septicum]|nr:pyridoxamine 5'-phosphate oxidase family protein [Mycolicibacterium septicum]
MSSAQRKEFLSGKHVAVLSIDASIDGRPPASAPIWYTYDSDGLIRFTVNGTSRKARLLNHAKSVSLVVQNEELPYQYVVVECSVVETANPTPVEFLETVGTRYLGEERGRAFMAGLQNQLMFAVRPDRWLTAGAVIE